MTVNGGKTILLVSNDAALCAAARLALEAKEEGRRVAAVSTVAAARGIVMDAAPAVILLEDGAATLEPEDNAGRGTGLESAVAALAAYAPVVVIGGATHDAELTALVAAGVADFVPRTGGGLTEALGLVEQRLRQAQQAADGALDGNPVEEPAAEAFGEVLRHELNNPLTGILGNAELLLAEVRRKNDGQLPNGGQQRLETIAALAVRLRETVRRLSQDWEARHHPVPARVAHQRIAH